MTNEVKTLAALLWRHGIDADRIAQDGLDEQGYWSFELDADGKKVYENERVTKTRLDWPAEVLADPEFGPTLAAAIARVLKWSAS